LSKPGARHAWDTCGSASRKSLHKWEFRGRDIDAPRVTRAPSARRLPSANDRPSSLRPATCLHDVGTGDGIIQGNARGTEFRTPPLWGLSQSGPCLHDGSAPSVQDAIQRHGNQGASARDAFNALSFRQQQALLAFLDSI